MLVSGMIGNVCPEYLASAEHESMLHRELGSEPRYKISKFQSGSRVQNSQRADFI